MSRTYLFSPIGNTDPVKYFYDGSMLHICRYYKPDVVYLYLSKEMMEYHRTDNRYVRSIELLGKKLNHIFEVHIIENDQMVNVQQYDVFYKEFRSIISDIEREKGEDDRLLVNGIRNACHEKCTSYYGNTGRISIFTNSGFYATEKKQY